MKICPITYQPCEGKYSEQGLKKLSQKLTRLNDFPYTAEEQIRESTIRSGKMSIQGVQPKLSAILKPKPGRFEIVDTGGRFILKPCPTAWAEVPENEALTMTLAARSGLDVPDHGLVASSDGRWTYWIRRFDREGRGGRLPVEDFAQLQGRTRETKYDSSMERVIATIEEFCTFPAIEKRKLARRALFCFLTGNEDMHLKNFSLVTRAEKVELSPAYDLLNTSVILQDPREELAMPIRGKMSNLTRKDLVDYFCGERCGLPEKEMEKMLEELEASSAEWPATIERSYLGADGKERYQEILRERVERLFK